MKIHNEGRRVRVGYSCNEGVIDNIIVTFGIIFIVNFQEFSATDSSLMMLHGYF